MKAQSRYLDRTTPPHLSTLVLLAGLSALSMNIFLPSLPNMAASFGVDYRLMQLSVSLYLAVSAALQLVIGPLSDRFGRRKVLLVGLVLFLIATIGTLIAPNAEIFLICRMGQACVAAALTLSRAIVRDMVDAARAASMLGYITMFMTLAPMVGPIIGGMLDEVFGWQASFGMLLICGVAITWLAWADVGETAGPSSGGMRAQLAAWPVLLRSWRFWGYVSAMTFTSASFFLYLGGAPFIGTEIYGLSPSMLGYYFGATAIGYTLGNFISARFSMRLGINRLIVWGALVMLAGTLVQLLLVLLDLAPAMVFFGMFITLGIGNGMILPGATAGSLSVRPELAGTASGLGGAITIGGGAAVSALAGAVLTAETGAWPLPALMLVTGLLAMGSILLVLREP